jgi:hypothetical protein
MKFTIEVSSVPDRNGLVAEVWLGNEMLAEIMQESAEKYIVEIYSHPNKKVWKVGYDEFIEALNFAKTRLAEYKG